MPIDKVLCKRMLCSFCLNAVRSDPFPYTWRVDLELSAPFWAGWFEGLSQTFLGTKVPKLLILAGISTLDVELTIGQMQGELTIGQKVRCKVSSP